MNHPLTKILVVDDRPANLHAMRQLLAHLQVEILVADSAPKGLEIVLAEPVALILLDVDMPEMDGYEMAEMVRGVKQTSHIPIIFLTAAYKDPRHLLRGYESGGVDYLEKPFDERILLSKVQVFLDLYRLRQEQEWTLLRLQQSEAKFRAMVDHVGVGMVRVALNGAILESNHAFCAILECDGGTLVGKKLIDIIHPADIPPILSQMQRLRQGEILSFQTETRFPNPKGGFLWGSMTFTLIGEISAEEHFFLIAMENITRRKQVEKALFESETRFRLLSERAQDIIFRYRLNPPGFEYVSPSATKLTGYTPEEHYANPQLGYKLIHPDDRRILENIEESFDEPVVLRWIRKDQSLLWTEIRNTPCYDDHGHLLAIDGIARDITQRKKAEEELHQAHKELRNSEERLRSILENTSLVVFIKDLQGRYLFINRRFEELFAITNQEIQGKNDYDLFPAEVASHVRANDQWALQSNQPIQTDEQVPHEDGMHFYISVKFTLRDGDNIPYAVCGISTDITKRKQEEEELRLAKEQAEFASRAKSEFLSAMSHEIRTPMNVVLGMSSVLLDTDLNQEQRHYVEMMHRSGGALLAIINDVLDFSRIESGHFALVDLPFSPTMMVTETVHLMQLSAEQKGLLLQMDVSGSLPKAILGDDGRVRQILVNLIGNAIKFTEQGRITVTLQRDPQKEEFLLFAVRDTGIGIAPDHLQRIFEQFTQAEAGINRRYGGTGLGLAISRKLVELMGGEIRVNSVLGEGSTFYFTLPVRLAAKHSMQPEEEESLCLDTVPGLRILLAEDSLDNQVLFQVYLKKTPHTLVMVKDGFEAVARIKEETFDLVLMDIQMPILDGYAATRQIRQWEEEEQRPPVIILALSAHASMSSMSESLTAGCDGHLIKPIKKQDLLKAIGQTARKLQEKE
ncbi:MAG: PAS domain S-box protein [Magnetococcales bacterium]|nr:PAS domain S-box protein [Magnetococcales bacterium]